MIAQLVFQPTREHAGQHESEVGESGAEGVVGRLECALREIEHKYTAEPTLLCNFNSVAALPIIDVNLVFIILFNGFVNFTPQRYIIFLKLRASRVLKGGKTTRKNKRMCLL